MLMARLRCRAPASSARSTFRRPTPGVVVHGVLNPSASSQVVLLERTLTGAIDIPDTSFDSTDPIISAGGIAITGATVEIIDSTGKVTRAVEDRMVNANGKGAGVYRVPDRRTVARPWRALSTAHPNDRPAKM